jgi:hypothetical protein
VYALVFSVSNTKDHILCSLTSVVWWTRKASGQ